MAVFHEGPEYNEIGYFGFEFDSTRSAEQTAALLAGRYSVFLVGDIVVAVWRDNDESDNCFSSVKGLVSVQTEIGGGVEMSSE